MCCFRRGERGTTLPKRLGWRGRGGALGVLLGLAVCPLWAQTPKGGWATFQDASRRLGITGCVWEDTSQLFTNATQRIRFQNGQKRTEVNGVTVWMNHPPEGVTSNTWRIAVRDLDFLSLAILPDTEAEKPKNLHVLLDPGHGGMDVGAVSEAPFLQEKAFSLAMANRLGPLLEKAGFTVSYTRTNDVALSLSQRAAMAKTVKADLLISLHANHAANTKAVGFETYVVPPSGYSGTANGSRRNVWHPGNNNDFQSTLLGFAVQRQFCASQTNRVDRGLKRASYYVLRETSCPAVLIEFGFLSNSGEAGEMLAETWQDAHAQLVADAVTRYAKRIEALDGAVAEKREADRKANEAWRAKLAQRNAAKRDAGQVATQPSKRPSSSGGVPQRLAAPFPLAPFPSNDDQDEPAAQPPPPRPVAVERGTNTAPLVVGRLIDFYMKENPDK